MQFSDIFSHYPELATRLVRVNKQLNEMCYLGNCNLDLGKEIVKILDIKPYAKKAVFDLYNPGEGEGTGIYFEATMFINIPGWEGETEDYYNVNLYDAGIITDLNDDKCFMLTMDRNENRHFSTSKNNIINYITDKNHIEINSLDVKSLYLLYQDCPSCYQYAKIKTKKDFQMMIDKFNNHDLYVILNLYLMMNCVVLDIDMPKEFTKAMKKFAINKYDYDEYVRDTFERDYLIKQIYDCIDKF